MSVPAYMGGKSEMPSALGYCYLQWASSLRAPVFKTGAQGGPKGVTLLSLTAVEH